MCYNNKYYKEKRMKEYKIIEIDGEKLSLMDENGKEFVQEFHFYDLEEKPRMGDTITMDERLLDPNFAAYYPFYEFGSLESEFGRKIDSDNHPELMILNLGGKEVRLKRFWG